MFYVFSLLKAAGLTTLIHNTEAKTEVKFLQKRKITEWCGLSVYHRAIT